MTMTLPSNLKESYVSGWYVFRFVQYNTTVNTTNLQISVSVRDNLLTITGVPRVILTVGLDKAIKVAGEIFTECVVLS